MSLFDTSLLTTRDDSSPVALVVDKRGIRDDTCLFVVSLVFPLSTTALVFSPMLLVSKLLIIPNGKL